MPETMTEEELFSGKPLPTSSDLTLGEDFYHDEDPDENDSRPRNQGDPISVAVGSPGYMAAHIVQECYETFGEATTEPEEFDRYYFPPQVDGYTGPAPVLIDILQADTPEELAQERIDKHVEFKTRWCAEHEVAYVVLTDMEDLLVSADALRAKITGETPEAAPAPATPQEGQDAPQAPRKRGVQRPRSES